MTRFVKGQVLQISAPLLCKHNAGQWEVRRVTKDGRALIRRLSDGRRGKAISPHLWVVVRNPTHQGFSK
jgi:hypothetical protein